MSILKHTADHYNGVIIDAEALPNDGDAFATALAGSLEEWRSQGKRGVWLKVPLSKSLLLPKAVEQGFKYHHAQDDYAMLTAWIADQPSTIPESMLYNVGVGAFLLNSKDEMLLVKEASGITRGMDLWKMPTGLVDRGENVSDAVVREVMEEAGLDVKFDRILAIRQSHGLAFGRSDLFFVCACRLAGNDETVKIQESELADAAWIPLHDAIKLPIFRGGALKCMMDACLAYYNRSTPGFKAEVIQDLISTRRDLLIFPDSCLTED